MDTSFYMPASGRVTDKDGNVVNLVDLLGGGTPVTDKVYDVESYAPKSGLILGEDGKLYNLVDLLKRDSAPAAPAGVSNYGVCSTEAEIADKTVSVLNFALMTGASVKVKFAYTNTADEPTLDVSSTGVIPIYYKGGSIPAGALEENGVYEFVYNGEQFDLVGNSAVATLPDEPAEPKVPDFSFVIEGGSFILYCQDETQSGETLNFTIDWGDGTQSTVDSFDIAQRTHTYTSTAEWTITIKDYVSGWILRADYEQKEHMSKIRRVLTPFPPSTTRTNFQGSFYNCSALTSIPENLFANNTAVTDFSHCFYGCSALTSIPENLFANNPLINVFYQCFEYCTALTSIPENLFANNVAVTDFEACFLSTKLTQLPENLFANNVAVTTFKACFNSCSALTSIPENLFANNAKVNTFGNCFSYCSALTSIPENLFANNPLINVFYQCFEYCTALTSIPENLFANNVAVTDFSGCFSLCTALTSIPENLFANNTAVTDFGRCFFKCRNMFFINIKLATSVLTRNTNYASMFFVDGNSYSHTGLAPELWKGSTTTTSYKSQCFSYNTALTNYADILAAWK